MNCNKHDGFFVQKACGVCYNYVRVEKISSPFIQHQKEGRLQR